MGKLTAQQIKNAMPKQKAYCLSDGEGLLLQIKPNGTKNWICRVYIHGKETRRGLGNYPQVSLKDARELAHEKKANPKTATVHRLSGNFAALAEAYIKDAQLAPNTKKRDAALLRCHILPEIGALPVEEITEDDIADLCDKIIREGIYDTASKVKSILSQIFKYAKRKRIIKHNPAADVELSQRTTPARHYPAVTGSNAIGELMRGITAYRSFTVRHALLLAAYTFCRPAEIANAEWKETDLDKGDWIIPAERMKLRKAHYVPLSKQAQAVLVEMKKRQNGRYIFTSTRATNRPISPETLRVALRIIGYGADEMTTHGFRSIASTVLNEYNWNKDIIEKQLAHSERDTVRGAYNRAEHKEERTAMVQWYADYLDAVRDGKEIPPKPTITITL